MLVVPEFPIDPRLKNVDQTIFETVFQEYKQNIDLVAIHLRDARNLLYGVHDDTKDKALCKATLLLAAAALESNLVYLSGVALSIAEKKRTLAPGQIRYLKGVEELVDENGEVIEVPAKQSLSERLQTVPTLLARTLQRTFEIRHDSAAFKKLIRTIVR